MDYATDTNVQDVPEQRAPEEAGPRIGLPSAIDPTQLGASAPADDARPGPGLQRSTG